MLFYSPVAWLVLIIFTFQSGLIFTNAIEMVEREQAMGYDPMFISSSLFGRLFYTVQDYLFLYIPLLTMGLVSRDLAGGTIKLLHSSPMTNTQIILGKFFSMMIFAFLLVGIFVIYVIYSLFMVEHFDVLYILTGIPVDLHVCLDRVVYVDNFVLPDYCGRWDVCAFDFLEFCE